MVQVIEWPLLQAYHSTLIDEEGVLSFHTSPNRCHSAFAKHSMIDSVTHVVPRMATFLSISEDTLSDFSISNIWTLAISLGFSTTGSGSFEFSGTNPRDLDPSTVSQAAHTLRTRTTIFKLHPSSSSTPLFGSPDPIGMKVGVGDSGRSRVFSWSIWFAEKGEYLTS